MKKILLVFYTALFAFSAIAQDSHLKFKGIPVDGNYKEFAQKLVEKGFKQMDESENGVVLVGNFMASPGVMVVVYPDPTSKVISNVSAMLETGDRWPLVEKKFKDTVATYKEKYGEPTEYSEEFAPDVYDSEYFRMKAIKEGQCYYRAIWDIEGGRIAITPIYFLSQYYIICAYIDEQNTKALKQTVLDDI